MRAFTLRLAAAIIVVSPNFAAAAPSPGPRPMRLAEVKGNALLFRTATPGVFLPVPMVGADIEVHIAGMAAQVAVRQQYYNPTDRWLEAVYVFPLGENGAVYRTRFEAGGHVIEGKIAERGEARRVYEDAARTGRRAGLVEQERPNIFTASVANIAPHEVVTVEIGYDEALGYADGRYRFRFPMVVAPRYLPAPPAAQVAGLAGGHGEAAAAADAVAATDRISPPVLDPVLGKANPVRMHIALDPGFPLATVESAYHPVTVSDGPNGGKEIALAEVPADRDFELSWAPKPEAAPVAAMFRETVAGDDYLLVTLMPPAAAAGAAATPRELTVVIDTSGSMFGASLAQAKRATELALAHLRPRDTFNLIAFASATRMLFPHPLPAGAEALSRGRGFLAGLKADGGTEMLPALRAALAGPAAPGRLGQVILVTDGDVGNEAALFREIGDDLSGRRLFLAGIGAAPNGFLLSRAASAGRGAYVHIGKIEEVGAHMGELMAKLERPAVTDIAARWPAPDAEPFPARMPDLYNGEPLVLFVRVPRGLAPGATLKLAGHMGDTPWRRTLALDSAAPGDGIATLWGRAKIAELMATLREGADPERVRAAVLETALRHHLTSAYTSLVAVDTTPTRPESLPLATRPVPTNLPDGWNYEKIFGDLLPDRGPPAPLPPPVDQREAALGGAQAAIPVSMPQTATPMALHLAAGLAATVAFALVLLWRRRSA